MNTKKSDLKTLSAALLLLPLSLLPVHLLQAHCQIPCGIYDDQTRFAVMAEDIATIEKAMQQIIALGQAQPVNYNQVVRWVNVKDQHADQLSDIVTRYFLAQRIKPADGGDGVAYQTYLRELTLLHRMVVSAMKTKQTTDLQHVETLKNLLEAFRSTYFKPESEPHH